MRVSVEKGRFPASLSPGAVAEDKLMATLDIEAAPLTPSEHQIQLRRAVITLIATALMTDYTGRDINGADAYERRS
jgi:hypothetical protein